MLGFLDQIRLRGSSAWKMLNGILALLRMSCSPEKEKHGNIVSTQVGHQMGTTPH